LICQNEGQWLSWAIQYPIISSLQNHHAPGSNNLNSSSLMLMEVAGKSSSACLWIASNRWKK
jgi:hypothetical protein